MLVREGYNLGSNKRDVGVELGGSAGKMFYNAAIFNGGRALRSDINQHKAWDLDNRRFFWTGTGRGLLSHRQTKRRTKHGSRRVPNGCP